MRERPRPLATWNENLGPVLWWRFPVVRPPYVGTPKDCGWPGHHTHWTPIPVPDEPDSMPTRTHFQREGCDPPEWSGPTGE